MKCKSQPFRMQLQIGISLKMLIDTRQIENASMYWFKLNQFISQLHTYRHRCFCFSRSNDAAATNGSVYSLMMRWLNLIFRLVDFQLIIRRFVTILTIDRNPFEVIKTVAESQFIELCCRLDDATLVVLCHHASSSCLCRISSKSITECCNLHKQFPFHRSDDAQAHLKHEEFHWNETEIADVFCGLSTTRHIQIEFDFQSIAIAMGNENNYVAIERNMRNGRIDAFVQLRAVVRSPKCTVVHSVNRIGRSVWHRLRNCHTEFAVAQQYFPIKLKRTTDQMCRGSSWYVRNTQFWILQTIIGRSRRWDVYLYVCVRSDDIWLLWNRTQRRMIMRETSCLRANEHDWRSNELTSSNRSGDAMRCNHVTVVSLAANAALRVKSISILFYFTALPLLTRPLSLGEWVCANCEVHTSNEREFSNWIFRIRIDIDLQFARECNGMHFYLSCLSSAAAPSHVTRSFSLIPRIRFGFLSNTSCPRAHFSVWFSRFSLHRKGKRQPDSNRKWIFCVRQHFASIFHRSYYCCCCCTRIIPGRRNENFDFCNSPWRRDVIRNEFDVRKG